MNIDSPKLSYTRALRTLWQEAFGDSDEFLDAFEQTAFSSDRCRCVTEDGLPIAALYWFDCSCRGERIAYLYAIATAKAYRGQGICTSLMEDTHRHLRELGYEGAVLVPGRKELFEFYGKQGYRVCGHVKELQCGSSLSDTDIRQIGADEYAELRRRYLPSGGVVQEKENLSFLQTQATLYAGEDYVLAAHAESDILYGAELLGDITEAPRIVRALGCTEGRFRTRGDGKPFAMYRPLGDKDIRPPEYFGLAFD